MAVTIGYQGIEGSFSELAAKRLADECGFKDVTFVPLKNSFSVINSLEQKRIDYALLASRNSIGGNVKETMDIIMDTRRHQLQLKRAAVFPIHQCLFKKDAETQDKDITKIVSHIQALHQTEKYRQKHFPQAEEVEEEDTALAAMKLANDEYEPGCAVICSYEAGIKYGLHLCKRNIEDRHDNRTEFRLFKLPDSMFVSKDSFDDAASRDPFITEYLGKGIIILILAFALWGITFIEGSTFAKISSLSAYILLVYVLYKKSRNDFNKRALKGYWKYYSVPDNKKDDSQLYHVPRVVRISHVDGHFRLDIYTNVRGEGQISVIGEPAYSFETGQSYGKLTYEYRPANLEGADVAGFAILKWYKKHPWSIINRMSGNYFGTKSKEIGSFTFFRISEEEFNDINLSQFITK